MFTKTLIILVKRIYLTVPWGRFFFFKHSIYIVEIIINVFTLLAFKWYRAAPWPLFGKSLDWNIDHLCWKPPRLKISCLKVVIGSKSELLSFLWIWHIRRSKWMIGRESGSLFLRREILLRSRSIFCKIARLYLDLIYTPNPQFSTIAKCSQTRCIHTKWIQSFTDQRTQLMVKSVD